MSATNHTTNYELPIFVGTDKPAWLVDWNEAMSAIDTALHQIEGKADQAGTDIGGIESSISTINSTLTSINNAVSQLRTDTNANTGSINTITSLIGNGQPTTTDKTIIGAINEIYADITGGGTDVQASNVSYDNTSSGLIADDVQEAIDEIIGYSTSEIVVGKWVDGNPICRKVLTDVVPTTASAGTASVGYVSIGANIDEVINLSGFVTLSDGRILNIPYITTIDATGNVTFVAMRSIPHSYATNPDTVELINTNTAWSGASVTLIIEYTKA